MAERSPDSKHKLYDKFFNIWIRNNDFTEGQDAVKSKKEAYLPKLPSQNQVINTSNLFETMYDLFLKKALLFPGASRTLKAYTGILSRKTPAVTFPDAEDTLLDTFTLEGEDVYTSAFASANNVMKYYLSAYLVDMVEDGDRPYAISYSAPQILDWRYEIIDGQRKLVSVYLALNFDEAIEDNITKVAHLQLASISIDEESVLGYKVTKYKKVEVSKSKSKSKVEWQVDEERIPLMDGRPLEFIPFVPITEKGLFIDLNYPLITDVVNINLAHYQNDAEYRNSLTFAGRPTPCVSGLMDDDSDIILGTPYMLRFTENGKWGFLGLEDTSGIGALRTAGDDLKQDMANTGTKALARDTRGVEAAETAKIHREGEHGLLSTVANVVSKGVKRTLKIMLEWMGVEENEKIDFVINTDFIPTSIKPEMISALWNMYMNEDISFQTLWHNLQKGEVTPEMKTAEQELEDIEAGAQRRGSDRVDLDNLDEGQEE